MSYTHEEFMSVLETTIARKLLSEHEIRDYTKDWRPENLAALLHANNINQDSHYESLRDILTLLAAFGRKDLTRIQQLAMERKVSVGVRLDYFLPLYDAHYRCGEDIFTATMKTLLGGNPYEDLHLQAGCMKHVSGALQGKDYTNEELCHLQAYVNNSFAIRNALRHAPNQSVIQPNLQALIHIVQSAATYRDTNNNPVITFIPGAISIDKMPVTALIEMALQHGAKVDDTGLFGVTGIIWSIILGDIAAVRKFIENHARLDIVDDMGNQHAALWAAATHRAMHPDWQCQQRMNVILQDLARYHPYQRSEITNHLRKKYHEFINQDPGMHATS